MKVTMVDDMACMKLAIDEANKCTGQSDTDPLVGAVLAKDGKLIGCVHRSQKELGFIVDLRIDSSQLDIIIRGHQRTDYEFSEWASIPLYRPELLSELIYPKRHYHPTTGYRLLYTFLRYFGSPSDEEYSEIARAI